MPQVNETIKKKKNILVWHKIQEEKSNGYDKKADVVMRQAIIFFFFFKKLASHNVVVKHAYIKNDQITDHACFMGAACLHVLGRLLMHIQ